MWGVAIWASPARDRLPEPLLSIVLLLATIVYPAGIYCLLAMEAPNTAAILIILMTAFANVVIFMLTGVVYLKAPARGPTWALCSHLLVSALTFWGGYWYFIA
jgi:hypothetical protein